MLHMLKDAVDLTTAAVTHLGHYLWLQVAETGKA